MKFKNLLLAIALAPAFLLADNWGVKELKQANDAALEHFKEKKGEKLFSAISGFSIQRTSQGDTGRAKVTYVENEETKTMSLFCHVHEADEIDCH